MVNKARLSGKMLFTDENCLVSNKSPCFKGSHAHLSPSTQQFMVLLCLCGKTLVKREVTFGYERDCEGERLGDIIEHLVYSL